MNTVSLVGRLVAVIGRLRQSSWTTAEGEKRSKLGVVAGEVIFLDSKLNVDNGDDRASTIEDDGDQPDWPARRNRSRTSA